MTIISCIVIIVTRAEKKKGTQIMKTVIFDVDDTLYDQAMSFHKTFHKVISTNYSYSEIDKIYRLSRKYSEELFDKSEAKEISVRDWQIGRILYACRDFEIHMDETDALLFHETYVEEQKKIKMFDEMRDLLDLLKEKGVQIAILTNGEESHQMMKIEQLALSKWISTNNIYVSGSYGVAKPKLEIFRIVEEKVNCSPESTIYIGDSFEKDIIGARKAGWQAIWFNHRMKKPHLDNEIDSYLEFQKANDIYNWFYDYFS